MSSLLGTLARNLPVLIRVLWLLQTSFLNTMNRLAPKLCREGRYLGTYGRGPVEVGSGDRARRHEISVRVEQL